MCRIIGGLNGSKIKNAFRDKQEFERWLSEPEHRHFKTSDEEAARVIRDKFLEDYGSLHLKK